MTEIKVVNLKIAEYLGLDAESLGNMGEVHAAFKEDVAEFLKKALLEKAVVEKKKKRVLKELLEFARGDMLLAEWGVGCFIGCKYYEVPPDEVNKKRYDLYGLWWIISYGSWDREKMGF